MNCCQVAAPNFDLALTLDSGQTFHWETSGARFVGTIGETAVYVEQRGDVLEVCGEAPQTAREAPAHRRAGSALPGIVEHYFSLDHPLAEICAALPDDPAMAAARRFCRGLRIIRQPRWECLASFITSSMKQVEHIRQISRALRQRFGHAALLYGSHVYAFPDASRLARATEAELRECALGYRARNLLATARLVASGEVNLDALAQLPDDALRARLCELPGVGPKVANCVMLFAYERLRAFPIDVWVERVLREKYFPRRRRFRPGELQKFAAQYFGAHGGYAQQYLFHHARKTTPRRLSAQGS